MLASLSANTCLKKNASMQLRLAEKVCSVSVDCVVKAGRMMPWTPVGVGLEHSLSHEAGERERERASSSACSCTDPATQHTLTPFRAGVICQMYRSVRVCVRERGGEERGCLCRPESLPPGPCSLVAAGIEPGGGGREGARRKKALLSHFPVNKGDSVRKYQEVTDMSLCRM